MNGDFKTWFGKSVVVDKNGDPLVVYHGTNAFFEEFKRAREGRYGRGYYFTTDPREARSYGHRIVSVYLKIEALTDATVTIPGEPPISCHPVIGDRKSKWDGLKTRQFKGMGEVYFVRNPKQIWIIKPDPMADRAEEILRKEAQQ